MRRVSRPANGKSKHLAGVCVTSPSLHLANEGHHDATLTATPLRAGEENGIGGGGQVDIRAKLLTGMSQNMDACSWCAENGL